MSAGSDKILFSLSYSTCGRLQNNQHVAIQGDHIARLDGNIIGSFVRAEELCSLRGATEHIRTLHHPLMHPFNQRRTSLLAIFEEAKHDVIDRMYTVDIANETADIVRFIERREEGV